LLLSELFWKEKTQPITAMTVSNCGTYTSYDPMRYLLWLVLVTISSLFDDWLSDE
jgi:hypothetical protein